MKQRLETVANVSMIVLSLLLAYVVVRTYVFPSSPSPYVGQGPKAGEQLAGINTGRWAAHSQTLVLALRSGCHYCEQSAPFYKRLVQMQASSNSKFGLLAILPDDASTAQGYLSSEGLPIAFEASIALEKLNIPGTPSVLLVDADGRVVRSWVGLLTTKQEAEVERDLLQGIAR